MGNEMEKPIEVTPGSRWRVDYCGCELVASDVKRRDLYVAVGEPACKSHDRTRHWGIYPPYCTYLGGPQPPPSTAVMEEDEREYPVHCLRCGGKRQKFTRFACDFCYEKDQSACDRLWRDWRRGARNFPRSPAAVPAAKPAHFCGLACYATGCPHIRSVPLGPGHDLHMHGERVAPNGTPLTALQKIQARTKPEPWVPSIDDYDLLPDA